MRFPAMVSEMPACVEAQAVPPQPQPVPTASLPYSVEGRSPSAFRAAVPAPPARESYSASAAPQPPVVAMPSAALAFPTAMAGAGLSPMAAGGAHTPYPSLASMVAAHAAAHPQEQGQEEGVLLGTIVLPPVQLGPEGLQPILDSFPKDLPSLLVAAWENGVTLQLPEALQQPQQPLPGEAAQPTVETVQSAPATMPSPFLAPVVLEGARSRTPTPSLPPARSPGLSPALLPSRGVSPSLELQRPSTLSLPPSAASVSAWASPSEVHPEKGPLLAALQNRAL